MSVGDDQPYTIKLARQSQHLTSMDPLQIFFLDAQNVYQKFPENTGVD